MVYAPDVWNRIVACAHRYAEPGVIFIDEVNRHNHMMESMGPIYATNPCAEQALHFNNSCNLGSIDLAKFYDAGDAARLGAPRRRRRTGASASSTTSSTPARGRSPRSTTWSSARAPSASASWASRTCA